MKITCELHPERREVLIICCDGEVWREVHTSIFGRKPSFEGCESLEQLSNQFFSLEYRLAKQYAVRRLAAQSLPSAALKRALEERLVSESTTAKLIQEFCELGYINDQQWTESFVRHQVERKLGPRMIAQKLSRKGISKEFAAKALEKANHPGQQQKALAHLLETRYRQRNLNNFKERQKVIASLIRRGFDLAVILDYFRGHEGVEE